MAQGFTGVWFSTDLPANTVGSAQIIDGTVAVADIAATGTPSASTYLRGDGAWATVSAGLSGSGTATYLPLWSSASVLADSGVLYASSAMSPVSNDGAALGTTSLKWSDLFLASGAVINFNSGNVTIAHSTGVLTVSGTVSSPGAGASSEHFGASSSAAGADAIAIGNGAAAAIASSIVIGKAATVTTGGSGGQVVIGSGSAYADGLGVAIGYGAHAGPGSAADSAAVAIGYGALASRVYSVAISGSVSGAYGYTIRGTVAHDNSAALGGSTTAVNQFVIGAETLTNYYDLYMGQGVVATAPHATAWHFTGASGADVAGADGSIIGSLATGNAASGALIFKTGTAGSSGSTLQTATTRFTIDSAGVVALAVGGLLDLSAIAAGSPNIKIAATSDTPAVTWTAHVPSADPTGYMEISVGGASRYVPFWT